MAKLCLQFILFFFKLQYMTHGPEGRVGGKDGGGLKRGGFPGYCGG
jgi:hypothetical protein